MKQTLISYQAAVQLIIDAFVANAVSATVAVPNAGVCVYAQIDGASAVIYLPANTTAPGAVAYL